MKLRHTIADRVAGFVRDWSLPRQFAGEDPTREAAKHDVRRLRPRLEEAAAVIRTSSPGRKQGWAVGLGGEQFELGQSHTGGIGRHLKGGTDARDESGRLGGGARDRPENAVLLLESASRLADH